MIFENSQGLLLDSYYTNDLVHSTPSSTGLNGVQKCFAAENIDYTKFVDDVDVYYVSRTYLTRHGAGEFREEDQNLKYVDQTNVTNEWQGSIRFGHFDDIAVKELKQRIDKDFDSNLCDVKKNKHIVLTHMNVCEPHAELDRLANIKIYDAAAKCIVY